MSAILASGGQLPDCVFAVNDVMAVGALARLRAAGMSVPGDVAVAGFDDIVTLRDVTPPLTTVRLPLTQMGEMAANMVLTGGRAGPAADRPRARRGDHARQHGPPQPAWLEPVLRWRRLCGTFRPILESACRPGLQLRPAITPDNGYVAALPMGRASSHNFRQCRCPGGPDEECP